MQRVKNKTRNCLKPPGARSYKTIRFFLQAYRYVYLNARDRTTPQVCLRYSLISTFVHVTMNNREETYFRAFVEGVFYKTAVNFCFISID